MSKTKYTIEITFNVDRRDAEKLCNHVLPGLEAMNAVGDILEINNINYSRLDYTTECDSEENE